ncbi:hypothetical protein UY3_14775 [Chelonia mydas]|uniref:Uncharacterized protein n=1 Tax=Chelonia mydas TaxID=8469 RepID=M7AYE8_CHEMY|nr:hypothetical protein UY3_14775 [Chelonia mydas]
MGRAGLQQPEKEVTFSSSRVAAAGERLPPSFPAPAWGLLRYGREGTSIALERFQVDNVPLRMEALNCATLVIAQRLLTAAGPTEQLLPLVLQRLPPTKDQLFSSVQEVLGGGGAGAGKGGARNLSKLGQHRHESTVADGTSSRLI